MRPTRNRIPILRLVVTAAFLLMAAAIVWSAFWVGADTPWGNVLVNLGTETFGIVVTVAVVEWFFEKRRHATRGRQLAWDALHAVESAVWVWQGGPRELETDELLGILKAVDDDDPLPDFTEGLYLNIGTRSRRLLTNEPHAVEALPGFMNALEELGRLASIRDGKKKMPSRKLADILEDGTRALARALGQPTERHLASLIRYRDPSVDSQERRHFGEQASQAWRAPGRGPT